MRPRTKQCKKCPWRKDVNPRDIPNGYCEIKHRGLDSTIATIKNLSDVASAICRRELPMMACHESKIGKEQPCVGWMANQLGPGNNIALRLWARKNLKKRLELAGEQHEHFDDTLPEAAT